MNSPATQIGTVAIEKQVVDWSFAKVETGEHYFVRFKYAKTPAPKVLSQNQPPRVVEFFRGYGDAKISVGHYIVSNLQLEYPCAKAKSDGVSEILHRYRNLPPPLLNEVQKLTRGKTVLCEVIVGRKEQVTENIEDIEEVFLFAYLPPDAFAMQDEPSRMKCLAECVLNLLDQVQQDQLEKLKAEGNARAKEQLKKFPRRDDSHEMPGVDHYKNRSEVALDLLRKEWPRFFEELDNLKLAKTEAERLNCQKRILIGYTADYKVLYGCYPVLKQDDAAEFARDDFYIRLISEAMSAKNSQVPKTDWQLVNGWIEKNYYRMNEQELEIAFNRDWNCSPQKKGNTLACRARTIGLESTLRRGRKTKRGLK
ncbi:MAG: hypothetical protein ACREFE_16855 [Limisphaerales bacterium]